MPPDELKGSYGDGATACDALVYCLERMRHTSQCYARALCQSTKEPSGVRACVHVCRCACGLNHILSTCSQSIGAVPPLAPSVTYIFPFPKSPSSTTTSYGSTTIGTCDSEKKRKDCDTGN